MNIVVDARTAHKGFPGIGRYVAGLLWGLKGITETPPIHVLSPLGVDQPYRLPDFPTVSCPATPFSLAQQWSLRSRLSSLKPALYHSPYYLMPYWPGVPTVLTCHDVIPALFPRYFTRGQRIIFRLASRLALRASSAVIAVSRQTKADLTACFKVDPGTVAVVEEAPTGHFYPRPEKETAAVRALYGLPTRYVLSVGTNKPHKNLARLVEAWSKMERRGRLRDFILVVAGHWDNRFPEPKRRAEELNCADSILFSGSIAEEHLAPLYSGAALFVMPSLYEGFGLPVLEAMACGTPVVCSKAGSLVEVGGTAVEFCDARDAEAMARAIEAILGDPERRESLRQSGLERAGTFSWERAATETLSVYASVAQAAR